VAPRAYWKGYLKLSLVSSPVALFPASSEREKISFNQIIKKTGNRIRYRKIDAETEGNRHFPFLRRTGARAAIWLHERPLALA